MKPTWVSDCSEDMVPRLKKPLDEPGGDETRCPSDTDFTLTSASHSLRLQVQRCSCDLIKVVYIYIMHIEVPSMTSVSPLFGDSAGQVESWLGHVQIHHSLGGSQLLHSTGLNHSHPTKVHSLERHELPTYLRCRNLLPSY